METHGKKSIRLLSADAPPKLAKTGKALRDHVPMPTETLEDLLRMLDHDDLEGSQLVHRQFTRASRAIFASTEEAGGVPRRKIELISVRILERELPTGRVTLLVINATRSSTDAGVTRAGLWREGVELLANVTRFSVVDKIKLTGSGEISPRGITSAMWSGFMNAFRGAGKIDILCLDRINFCPLSAVDIGLLTTLSVRTELSFSASRLPSNHITDEFLQKLSRMGLSVVIIVDSVPADKELFDASDDGVLALCFPDERRRTKGQFTLENVGLTDAFFGNFLLKFQAAPEDSRDANCLVHPIPSGSERQIMALNATRDVDADGDISFLFDGTECAFMLRLSEVPRALYCDCS